MNVVETSKGFEVDFDYDPKKVDAMRQIPGARWVKEKGYWHVPLFRKKEIKDLIIMYGSHYEYLMIPEQVGPIPSLPELRVDIPLARPMFSFQKPGVQYILDHGNRVIIGDDMGLGKTTQAIAAVIAANKFPCLVVCPTTLKLNWQNEWKMVAGRRCMILNDTNRKSWHLYMGNGHIDVFIVNYESLPSYFVREIIKEKGKDIARKNIIFRPEVTKFKSMLFDELHKCKKGQTRNAKICVELANKAEMVLGLTGTILVNEPKDLIAQLAIVGKLSAIVAHLPQPKDEHGKLIDYSGAKRFTERYCMGGKSDSNLKELNYRLWLTCYYRRLKGEVHDLPGKTRQVLLCEISNRKEYFAAQTNLAEYLRKWKNSPEPDVQRKLRGEAMVQMGILKQLSAKGKMEQVQEWIQENLDCGEKVIVFCYLKEIMAQVVAMFPGALQINGDISEGQRQRNVVLFQTDPDRKIIVINYKSGGVGLNLTAACKVGFVEFPWTDADCDQCESRADRIGQKFPVQVTYFLGSRTIDEHCYYNIILNKRDMGREVTGDTNEISESIVDGLLKFFDKAN